MKESELIRRGIDAGLIEFDDDRDPKRITCLQQGKTRNYANPEEKVQAETYVKLVLDYKATCGKTNRNRQPHH